MTTPRASSIRAGSGPASSSIDRAAHIKLVGKAIDVSSLRLLIKYDPALGVLEWRERSIDWFYHTMRPANSCAAWNARFAGLPALATLDRAGYRRGKIYDRDYFAHRVGFAIYHGFWPKMVDHINGDRGDNRIANLRESDALANGRNMARSSRNASGVVGVTWCPLKGKWRARIKLCGKDFSLGNFDNFEDAVAARRGAEVAHGFDPLHGHCAETRAQRSFP